jgi:hypothetical protein
MMTAVQCEAIDAWCSCLDEWCQKDRYAKRLNAIPTIAHHTEPMALHGTKRAVVRHILSIAV